MTQEQDPFIGADGEEDDSLIMAPLLIDKLQVGLLPSLCSSALLRQVQRESR
jgi:hypothetical protein